MRYSCSISQSIASDRAFVCGIRQVTGRDVEGIFKEVVNVEKERERKNMRERERKDSATGKLQRLGKERREKTNGGVGL